MYILNLCVVLCVFNFILSVFCVLSKWWGYEDDDNVNDEGNKSYFFFSLY